MAPAAEFAAIIDAYRVVPERFASPLALALPWIEMWVGTFLLAGYRRRQAAWAAVFLLGIFWIAVASSLIRGLDLISCGCFGADAMRPSHTLILDACLLALALAAALVREQRAVFSLDRWVDS